MLFLAYAAAASLGIIVGWLIRTFVQRSPTLTLKAIMSLASLAAGGVVVAAAGWLTETRAKDAVYMYPIGALAAILILGLLDLDETKLKR